MKLLLLVVVFVAVNSAPLDPKDKTKEEAKEEGDTSNTVSPDSFPGIFHETPDKIEYPVADGAVAGHFSGEFPAVVYQMPPGAELDDNVSDYDYDDDEPIDEELVNESENTSPPGPPVPDTLTEEEENYVLNGIVPPSWLKRQGMSEKVEQ